MQAPARVISVGLSEEEWQAFVRQHPKPVDWLQERIRETIGEPRATAASLASAAAAASRTSATTR